MTNEESKALTAQIKFGSSLKTIFGCEISESDFAIQKDFIEIKKLTRTICLKTKRAVPEGLKEAQDKYPIIHDKYPIMAKLEVGFVKSDICEFMQNLFLKITVGENKVFLFEKYALDQFWRKDYKEVLDFLNSLETTSKLDIKSAMNIFSLLKDSEKNIPTAKEKLLTISFSKKNIVSQTESLKGIFKVVYNVRSSGESFKLGYMPKLWSVKDFASWILVTDRFPTSEEARRIQKRLERVKNEDVKELQGL